MGYTHYYSAENCTDEDRQAFEKALPLIRDILKRHAGIVCQEFNRPGKLPIVTADEISFNGKGKEGHETFIFRLGQSNFCKTARKPYDLPVCEILLVLNAFVPGMTLGSDGFSGVLAEAEREPQLDESWMDAIENVRRYGIHYHVEITRRRKPFCDMTPVLDRIVDVRDTMAAHR